MSDERQRRGKASDRGTGDEARNRAEWTSLLAGSILLLILVGLVSYPLFAGPSRPPIIAVMPKLEELRREPGGFYLPVEVVNRGDLTAEELRLRLILPAAEGGPETAEVVIQFLAGGERARAIVVFRGDPSVGGLRAEVVSFLEP